MTALTSPHLGCLRLEFVYGPNWFYLLLPYWEPDA